MGNVRDVTTSSPVSTVFSSDYKPYGLNYGLSESHSIFNLEYTDKPYDFATGLHYFGARFYDPSIERFITEGSPQCLFPNFGNNGNTSYNTIDIIAFNRQ